MKSFSLPLGHTRIKVVDSFDALVSTPFSGAVNALCWQRELPGDFGEIVAHCAKGQGLATLDDDDLQNLSVRAAGRAAVEVISEDLRRLRALDLDPVLDCISEYRRDEDAGPVPTDVHSFHIDSATGVADTWLCTYHGPASEGLSNEEARRRVDVPETREQLLQLYGGQDDGEFLEYLNENCFDLHYVPTPQARPFSFGVGNLWRIAVDHPGSPVAPCIHRAPEILPGHPPRLLLIS